MSATIQLRRGTAATWTSVNPTLHAGEPGYETDTGRVKIGDGATAWTSLSYAAPGQPLGLTGATAATRYVGGTASGAPASGTFAKGDFNIGQDGSVWICTAAGSPGTWTQVSGGGGGGIPSGTSFPGSPSTNAMFFRTDRGLAYSYDGTRWLTLTLYEVPLSVADTLDGGTAGYTKYVGLATDYAAYLVQGWVTYVIVGTDDGSDYWSFQFTSKHSPNVETNRGSSVNTSAGANATYGSLSVTMGIALTTAEVVVTCAASKTGSPGGLYMFPVITYRLIG